MIKKEYIFLCKLLNFIHAKIMVKISFQSNERIMAIFKLKVQNEFPNKSH